MGYPNEEEAEGVKLAFENYATRQYWCADVAWVLNERATARGAEATGP